MPESIQSVINSTLAIIQQSNFWWQILALILAIVISAFINRRIQSLLKAHSDSSHFTGIRHIAIRSLQRLLWPVVALLLIVPARAIMRGYMLPVNLLDIAIPILTALAAVRMAVYTLRKVFTANVLLRSSENVLTLFIWMLVILHLLGWLPTILTVMDNMAVSFGEFRISVLSAINLLLIIAVAFVVALWLAELINKQVQRMPGVTPSFKVGVSKFSRFLLITLAFLLALNAVGINLSSLAIFGGALGVGLGFGLQQIASNFISGFILVLDRSIKPGDIITVGDKFGWVQELKARYIVVRNREGVDTLIPNENLITSQVINWSYADPNVRIRVSVQISYDDDPAHAMEIMLNCAEASSRVLQDPAPAVRLIEFADSGIALELRVWVNDPINGFAQVRSDINLAIWKAFKEADITIPYPQRDLHIKSGLPESWADGKSLTMQDFPSQADSD
ncbi:mechanosensitive ion channel family protein [Pseudohongiella nitratireducens]|uniref:mechanosensitive ion channel family protein n=1 Tax=Pseudohongiella nitratireducens TaxID=1768907 RepID=UPI0030EEE523